MVLPDPAGSRAVLIGINRYPGISDLPAVANNIDRLAQLLTDPELWGLDRSHCTVLANPSSRDSVIDAIFTAAIEASDTLFIYFAGHGMLDEQTSELLLAMPDTTDSVRHNAIRYDDIRRVINRNSLSTSKVVMLDCCFSGAALEGFMGASSGIADRSRIDGTYLITASAETAAASAPPGETYTAFTGEVIRALQDGVPGGPDLLDMDTLYWHVRQELEVKERPLPQQRARNSGGTIILGRNRRGRGSSVGLQPALTRPDVPDGADHLMSLEPRDFFEMLDQTGRDRAAVLLAAGARRPDQEVAGLVLFASREGQSTSSDAILAGASRRPAGEICSVATELRELGLSAAFRTLVQHSATQPARVVAELAAVLIDNGWPDAVRDLLDTAAEHWGTPESIVGLVGALSLPALRPAADAMLVTKASRTAPLDAIVIADALLGGGRDKAAFCFYERGLELVILRPEAEIASLVSAMAAADAPAHAMHLSAAAFESVGSPEAFASLAAAFWDKDLGAWVDPALQQVATGWVLPDVMALGKLIRRAGRADAELRLFATAAVQGGADTTITLMIGLQDAGVPRSARQLVDEVAAALSPGEAVRLVEGLLSVDQPVSVQRVVDMFTHGGPQRAADLDPADGSRLAAAYAASVDHDMAQVADKVRRVTEPHPLISGLLLTVAQRASDATIIELAKSLAPDDWRRQTLTYLVAGTPNRSGVLARIVSSLQNVYGRDWLRTIASVAEREHQVSLPAVVEGMELAGFATDVDKLFNIEHHVHREWFIDLIASLDPAAARQIFDEKVAIAPVRTIVDVADGLQNRPQHVQALLDSFLDHRRDAAAAKILARALVARKCDSAAHYLEQRLCNTTPDPATRTGWIERRR